MPIRLPLKKKPAAPAVDHHAEVTKQIAEHKAPPPIPPGTVRSNCKHCDKPYVLGGCATDAKRDACPNYLFKIGKLRPAA